MADKPLGVVNIGNASPSVLSASLFGAPRATGPRIEHVEKVVEPESKPARARKRTRSGVVTK